MTAGQPAAYHTDSRAHSARQEAEIRALLARGVAETVIASAVGCAVARVRHVATTAPTPPPPVPEPRTPPARLPTPHTTAPSAPTAVAPATLDLLAAARHHPASNVRKLADRITRLVVVLREAIAAEDADTAALRGALRDLDVERDRLRAALGYRTPTRRATDQEQP